MAAPFHTPRQVPVEAHKYHEQFCSAKADMVLRSSDDVLYRVHSYTLRTTSGFFRTMFTLPQPTTQQEKYGSEASSSTLEDTEEQLPTYEPSSTLTDFLLLLSGKELPTPISQWSFDAVENVLTLAENWDAPGVISVIRLAILAPAFLDADPLRVYALALHFDWDDEKDMAARHTFHTDLLSSSLETLARLSSKDLMCLMRMRKARIDMFTTLIHDVHRFSAGNNDAYACARCTNSRLNNQTWKDLKQSMLLEIDRRPLGDTISGYAVGGVGGRKGLGVMEWKEAEACWAAKCQNASCGAQNYDKTTTLKQIKHCVDELPWR